MCEALVRALENVLRKSNGIRMAQGGRARGAGEFNLYFFLSPFPILISLLSLSFVLLYMSSRQTG